MSKRDWFRKTSWSLEDKADFFAHLHRARPKNRAQYLRIQAHHLQEIGSPETLYASLELLELIFRDYPVESQIATAYHLRAQGLLALGDIDASIQAFRQVFEAQHHFPSIQTNAHLDFGLLVVRHRLSEYYDEALCVLHGFTESLLFAFQVYIYYAVKAIIASEMGDVENACQWAIESLSALDQTHSGLQYHPTVGLVRQSFPDIDNQLEAIIGIQQV